MVIKPQPGFQENYLSNGADIVIGGSGAGVGKTFALLMEPLRYLGIVEGWGGVIFRRTTPQIKLPGGLRDTSVSLYQNYPGAEAVESRLKWRFPNNGYMQFHHLQYEKDADNFQGSQIPFFGFDELTHFSRRQFSYMFSRNRFAGGGDRRIFATCNPDPDHWLREFLDRWIDPDTGYPITERDGKIRYMVLDGDNIVWGDSYEEVIEKAPHIFDNDYVDDIEPKDLIKTVSFVSGKLKDNKKLMDNDPGYLGNLMALDEADKIALLEGNRNISSDGLGLFEHNAIKDLPSNYIKDKEDKCITVDAARFGKDLFVLKVWLGFYVDKVVILTKSSIPQMIQAIENEREKYGIQKSRVLVDEDGVGGGVVDNGYKGFHGGASAMADPEQLKTNSKAPKENYNNLKTQCAYRMAKRVNKGEIGVNMDNIHVDGQHTDIIIVKKKTYRYQKLLNEDLRSFKRDKTNTEGKLCIVSKDKQKIALNDRSPDNGDTFIMREFFELQPVQEAFYYEI